MKRRKSVFYSRRYEYVVAMLCVCSSSDYPLWLLLYSLKDYSTLVQFGLEEVHTRIKALEERMDRLDSARLEERMGRLESAPIDWNDVLTDMDLQENPGDRAVLFEKREGMAEEITSARSVFLHPDPEGHKMVRT